MEVAGPILAANMDWRSRRAFLRSVLGMTGLGLLAGCGVLSAPARPTKVPRIGILSLGTAASLANNLGAFRGGLGDLGYVEGRGFVLDPRFGEGRSERYPGFVADLVQLGVAVIVTNEPNG